MNKQKTYVKRAAPKTNSKGYFSLKHAGLICILGIILYSNTLNSPLVFDDHHIIIINDEIKSDSIFAKINTPRYLGVISFALNYRINELAPYGYHLINLLIHLINGLLVYWLMLKIFLLVKEESASKLALIIALLFIAHPIQTQAITYISQRFASLASLFAIGSLVSYMRFRQTERHRIWFFILSLILALCAYKTKENTIVLPLILVMLETILYTRDSESVRKRILYIVPFVMLTIFVISSFVNFNQPIEYVIAKTLEKSRESITIPRDQYLYTEFRVIITYIRLLFLPINQSFDYSYELSQSFFEIRTFISFLVILLLVTAAIMIRKKHAVISAGILWFFIFLIIESSVIPISDVIFEHRIYLPSIGLIMAFVYGVYNIFKRYGFKGFNIVMIIIIAVLSVAAYSRNNVWKDRVKLWKDCADKFPKNFRCHLNLGGAYFTQGKYDEAIREIEVGLRGRPKDLEHRRVLALSYLKKGEATKAVDAVEQAIQLEPKFIQFYYQAGSDLLEKKNYDTALVFLNSAYSHRKTDWFITTLLGRAYCMVGKIDQALYYYGEALNLPGEQALVYRDRGFCLFNQGRYRESRADFVQAVNLNPALHDCYEYIAKISEKERN